ncbi:pirin family protein [Candidatus Uhrbacteria bacterium]|nr:pirin family protein [Candidatus Uhrbacteria bacterium]
MSIRTIQRIFAAKKTFEGSGFQVRRPFPTDAIPEIDPFLLLDEMGPTEHGPGEAQGAPDHPHRGFETVTYMLSGRMQHTDSHGNKGIIGPGDVQWMTAGDGIIHSEMPDEEFQAVGGKMHGIQLWINLPRQDKRMKPRYQDISVNKIPKVTSPDGLIQATVIAGNIFGVSAQIETRIPITYLHLHIQPGGVFLQNFSPTANVFAYILDGSGQFGEKMEEASEGDIVIFAKNGENVKIATAPNATKKLNMIVLAGEPLNEPIARYGPFVMNTEKEILEAITDYRNGRFGTINTKN